MIEDLVVESEQIELEMYEVLDGKRLGAYDYYQLI